MKWKNEIVVFVSRLVYVQHRFVFGDEVGKLDGIWTVILPTRKEPD
jgi:hypothetical protein